MDKPTASWVLTVIALLLSCRAVSGTIYRWVDEQGRTQISDTVPERFKNKAIRIDTQRFEVSPEQTAQAQRELARQRAALDKGNSPSEIAGAAKPASTAASGLINGRPPAPLAAELQNCTTWRRAYAASQACFEPFRNVNGSIKSEAFTLCREIPDPSPKCGTETLSGN